MGLKAGWSTKWLPVSVIALAVAFAAPGIARAAAPAATTGGAAPVTFSTALLHGTVNPSGHATSFYFQYGTTTLYGATNVAQSAGNGHSAISVTGGIGALAPNTLYHYRIVAQYSAGIVKGKDRTFRTKKQPLGLSLAGVPNPDPFGSPVTLSGSLTGTGNANRTVVLQSNPFPFTQGFVNAANAQVTNAQGGFSFPILSVPVTTQYRVFLAANSSTKSPVLTLGVAMRVNLSTSSRRVRRGSKLGFKGTLQPALSGVAVLIQRRRHGHWSTVGRTLSRHRVGSPVAKFSKRVRIRRGGFYRVEAVVAGGSYVTGDSGLISIHTR